jgi:hypothetical protein
MMPDKAVLPNTCGHHLLVCCVEVQRNPPFVSSNIHRVPIVAFVEEEDGSFTPAAMTGPLKYWLELCPSDSSCYVWAVEQTGAGVSTAHGAFKSAEDFQVWAEHHVAEKVAEIRRARGWPAETIPGAGQLCPRPPTDHGFNLVSPELTQQLLAARGLAHRTYRLLLSAIGGRSRNSRSPR